VPNLEIGFCVAAGNGFSCNIFAYASPSAVGNTFGVTKGGKIYASEGTVGSVNVKEISSKTYVTEEIKKLKIIGKKEVDEWTQAYVKSE
jgi:hypothetical protein